VNQFEPDDPRVASVPVRRISRADSHVETDILAVEEPLEIRVGCTVNERRVRQRIAVTMRTPGDDADLAVGYLLTEGIVTEREQIQGVHSCGGKNAVRVDLRADVAFDLERLDRHSYTSSSCGVCGKKSIDSIRVRLPHHNLFRSCHVDAEVIERLPSILRDAQPIFARTGGLHASALFDFNGHLQSLKEDVGRHNALDKLIGAEFREGRTPLSDRILLVSGRASFELVQKAAVAGVPILAAVGAPSSLAVELAAECGMTLIGFVKRDRFNIYAGAGRIQLLPSAAQVPRLNGERHVQLANTESRPAAIQPAHDG
jgi:FdhD protein